MEAIRTRRERPVLIAVAFAALAAAAAAFAFASGAEPEHAKGQEPKHWSYADGPHEVGPKHWGSLPEDKMCSLGKRQSPIALGKGAAPAAEPHEVFSYKASKVSLVNNGHTVQETYDAGSSLTEGGATYSLAQFHFHTPSEHKLHGKSYPLEIHLVHTDADGKPALVLGIFVKEGAENAALKPLLESFPKTAGEKSEPAGASIDVGGLLPADRAHYAYDGSLTTPPCTEGIRWRVLAQPIEMSHAQIEAAEHILRHRTGTNRPIQPAHGRPVTFVATQ
jgi:carbonic anhydrase